MRKKFNTKTKLFLSRLFSHTHTHTNSRFSKRGITPVVAVALLLVVAVMAVVGFNSWFKKYQSNLLASTQQTNSDLNAVVVNGLYNGHLYLTNNNLKDITVKSIFLNNYKCPFYPTNYSHGNIDLDLVYCLMKIGNPQIVNLNLLTSDGLISKKLYSNGDLPKNDVDLDSPFIFVINTNYSYSNLDIDPVWLNHLFINTSNSTQFRLPLVYNGVYDFKVCWGDGTCNIITNWNQSQVLHNYANQGIYEISIIGHLKGWSFWNSGCELSNDCQGGIYPQYSFEDGPKITNIKNWGCLQLGNIGNYFEGCTNLLNITTKTSLDLNDITTFSSFFYSCWNLSYIQDINKWNTKNIVVMNDMFIYCYKFNQPLNNWNTSKVKNMAYLFYNAKSFNQPLNNWNVHNVINLDHVFYNAYLFNQPLNNWDVSNVKVMRALFCNAKSFNQSLSNWNTSNVIRMDWMFYYASSFYQNISMWNVNSVTNYTNFDINCPIYNTSYEPHFKN